LRQRLAVVMGLAMALMLSRGPAGAAGGGTVTGVISNWHQVKGKVSDKSYFQLVKNVHMKSASTDKDGLQALKSDLPQVSVRNTGGFQVNLDSVPPGEYFIALQRGLPTTPILLKDGKPLLIRVPGKFPLNVGNVKLEMPLGHAPPRQHMEVVK
jgi:hypothetical protein